MLLLFQLIIILLLEMIRLKHRWIEIKRTLAIIFQTCVILLHLSQLLTPTLFFKVIDTLLPIHLFIRHKEILSTLKEASL
jgi:hypothetical protein